MFQDIFVELTVILPRLTPLGTKKNVQAAAERANNNCILFNFRN